MLEQNRIISPIGEFIDKDLEKEYFDLVITKTIKYIRPLMLAFGILYFLFIIPDYYLIKNATTFKLILLSRNFFTFFSILFYCKLKQSSDNWAFKYWITMCEVIFVISFLMIVYLYESPNFLIESLGVIIILMAVFLIPNRWVYMFMVSDILIIAFFTLSAYILDPFVIRDFYAALVYVLMAISLNSISSWRINYYKRMQYLSSKNLIGLSRTDSLTQINNRLKFNEELQKAINFSRRYKTDLSLILFDIDDFKKINDDYGHLVGDKVLIGLSGMVENSLRDTDIFARWGGEEFAILLPHASIDRARLLAQKIRVKIENYSFDADIHITCSFGVDLLCDKEDIGSLLERIDKFLYRAKILGKNTVISDFKGSFEVNAEQDDFCSSLSFSEET